MSDNDCLPDTRGAHPVAPAEVLLQFKEGYLNEAEAIALLYDKSCIPQSPGLREALEHAANIAEAIDSGRGNENEIAKAIRNFAKRLAAQSPVLPPSGVEEWRCFHCNEVFTDKDAAREHFGFITILEPGCIDPMRGNEKALRRREMQSESLFRKVCDQRDQLFNELKELRALSASVAGEANPIAWRWKIRLNQAWCYDDRKPYSYPDAQPLYAAPSPALDPGTVEGILANFNRQRAKYRENADNPKFSEQQQETWAALSNEKADDLDYLRRALASPAPEAGGE